MNERTTSELNDILKNTTSEQNLQSYLNDLDTSAPAKTFADFFKSLPEVSALTSAEIILKSGIERTYYYQLINGRRHPGRDKVLLLCLAAGLSIDTTQRALKKAELSVLYAKNRRDAIVIYALENHLSTSDTQDLLEHFRESLLQ